MKFKKVAHVDYRRLEINGPKGYWPATLRIETFDPSCHKREGVYVEVWGDGTCRGVMPLSKAKALKMAWAIIEELDPYPF